MKRTQRYCVASMLLRSVMYVATTGYSSSYRTHACREWGLYWLRIQANLDQEANSNHSLPHILVAQLNGGTLPVVIKVVQKWACG